MAESLSGFGSPRRTDYYCRLCSYRSERKFNVERHWVRIHTKRISKLCCGRRFLTKGDFYYHAATMHANGRVSGGSRAEKYKTNKDQISNIEDTSSITRRSNRIREKNERTRERKLRPQNPVWIRKSTKNREKLKKTANSTENERSFGQSSLESSDLTKDQLLFEDLAEKSVEQENSEEIQGNELNGPFVDHSQPVDVQCYVDNLDIPPLQLMEEVGFGLETDPADLLLLSLINEESDEVDPVLEDILTNDSNNDTVDHNVHSENQSHSDDPMLQGVLTDNNNSIHTSENREHRVVHPKKEILRKFFNSSAIEGNKENVSFSSASGENATSFEANSPISSIRSKKIRFSTEGNAKMSGLSPLREITEVHRNYLSAIDFSQHYYNL